MVGHTGNLQAAIKAVETVDACVGRVLDAVLVKGGAAIVTADHGNADEMRDAGGNPVTAHSLNPVPIVAVGRSVEDRRLRDGVLADVTPTILDLAGLPPWPGITGHSLLEPG